MAAIAAEGSADIVAVADPSADNLAEAVAAAPGSVAVDSLDALLDHGLDGLVIATPSALHAEQAIRALDQGVAVFCQKPLGRNAAEVEAVLAAAQSADRLLGVDLSYRHTAAMVAVRQALQDALIGNVHAVDLIFHNAYGPDKPWFYDPSLAGGGCVIDLGVHLVDLALWALDWPAVAEVASSLYANGVSLTDPSATVEDLAFATLTLANGATMRLACSWRLPAGCDAVIAADFYGPHGALRMRNIGGSFYDFTAEHCQGTARTALTSPPDEWGGRAAMAWARRLTRDRSFDPSAMRLLDVAAVLDRIYA
ncbi:putative dehydrogenase [Sphingomonas zeicaulis]